MPKMQLDDFEMFYVIDDYTDPWTEPDTVFLHHGGLGNHKLWYSWVPGLARRYRVVRVDARGHGQSSQVPPDFKFTNQQLAKDSKDLLDKLDIDKVHFMGYSFGGGVAQTFAVEYPDRVKSVVLCSTTCKFTTKRDDWVKTAKEKGVEAQVRGTVGVRFNFDTAPPGLVDWYCTQLGQSSLNTAGLFLQNRPDLRSQLPNIKVPALILAAQSDSLTPLEDAEYMANTIPDADLVIFDDVGHNFHIQYPELCVEKALEFLEKKGF